jgi:hypothetical protein
MEESAMSGISQAFANGAAIASGFIAVRLFELLIEKGIISADEGRAVLEEAHADVARAVDVRRLDSELVEAHRIVSVLYRKLADGGEALPASR